MPLFTPCLRIGRHFVTRTAPEQIPAKNAALAAEPTPPATRGPATPWFLWKQEQGQERPQAPYAGRVRVLVDSPGAPPYPPCTWSPPLQGPGPLAPISHGP